MGARSGPAEGSTQEAYRIGEGARKPGRAEARGSAPAALDGGRAAWRRGQGCAAAAQDGGAVERPRGSPLDSACLHMVPLSSRIVPDVCAVLARRT